MTNAPVYYVVALVLGLGFALSIYSDSNSAIYSWDHLIADEAPLPEIDAVPFIEIPPLQEN